MGTHESFRCVFWSTSEHTPLDTLSLCVPLLLFCRFLPHSAGGGNPKAMLFMLNNNLYVHPSLSEIGDHKNLPEHPNHLGNGEEYRNQAPLCVTCWPVLLKTCATPLACPAIHDRATWQWGGCLYVPNAASDGLAKTREALCPSLLVTAQTDLEASSTFSSLASGHARQHFILASKAFGLAAGAWHILPVLRHLLQKVKFPGKLDPCFVDWLCRWWQVTASQGL